MLRYLNLLSKNLSHFVDMTKIFKAAYKNIFTILLSYHDSLRHWYKILQNNEKAFSLIMDGKKIIKSVVVSMLIFTITTVFTVDSNPVC